MILRICLILLCFLLNIIILYSQNNDTIVRYTAETNRPRLGDSINFPIFSADTFSIIDSLMSNIIAIYEKEKLKKRYSRVFFRIEINPKGNLVKDSVIFLSKNIKRKVRRDYPKIIQKLQRWYPATKKDSGLPVSYSLNFEIEYDNRDWGLYFSVFNMDYQTLYSRKIW